ncbi:17899_t:CDS:2 [Cetraspora pellucida]|uniref:17899_t:CDS:1 n=1 Tax=Cetraspora pellucida TaxID=1433469 RepID=A0A9N9HQA0_9GLOM|nr:17899_t:CDS:2 [Cetraspora pellucida]
MHHLKKIIALPNNKDEDYYVELLYGELDMTASQSLSINMHSDDKIVDLAAHANQALNISHGCIQKYKNISVNSQQNSDLWFKKLLGCSKGNYFTFGIVGPSIQEA